MKNKSMPNLSTMKDAQDRFLKDSKEILNKYDQSVRRFVGDLDALLCEAQEKEVMGIKRPTPISETGSLYEMEFMVNEFIYRLVSKREVLRVLNNPDRLESKFFIYDRDVLELPLISVSYFWELSTYSVNTSSIYSYMKINVFDRDGTKHQKYNSQQSSLDAVAIISGLLFSRVRVWKEILSYEELKRGEIREIGFLSLVKKRDKFPVRSFLSK